MPAHTPAVSGAFRCIDIVTEPGSLVDARHPSAVAAGNVETSMRIVDVLLGALAKALPDRVPGREPGHDEQRRNGATLKTARWDYYETIGGGTGAHPQRRRRLGGAFAHDQYAEHAGRKPGDALSVAGDAI